MTDGAEYIPLDDLEPDRGPEPPPADDPAAEVRRLPVLLFEEMEPSLDVADFVEGLLIDGGLSLFYGASNSGKTFLVCDIGFHVAMGWPWHGREVEPGAVLYVAGEGGAGIKNRIAAFRLHHGGAAAGDVPFAVVPTSLDLHNPTADTAPLIATIKEMADRFGIRIRLVIIDTVSRALAGGDENDSAAMGALVRNVDRIRHETGTHVALVHHSGKDSAKGARGHSLLRAAVDTEVEVTRDHVTGLSVAKVTKQRDMAMEGEIAFRLEVVELGTNRRGKPVTSCVIVPTDEQAGPRRRPTVTGAAKVVLDLLRKAIEDAGELLPVTNHTPPNAKGVTVDLWRRFAYSGAIADSDSPEARKKAFKRAADRLHSAGLVGTWEGWAWITE